MGRGLVLVLVAAPVCAAVAAMVGVTSVDVLVRGEPVGGGEIAQAAIFFFGPLFVVGFSIHATTRAESSRPVMASLLALGTLSGLGLGGWFGWGIVQEKRASEASRVVEACGWVDVPDCEARARECIHAVDASEAPVERGLSPGDLVEDAPGVPRTPEARALYRCLQR